MEVTFERIKEQKLCCSISKLRAQYGPRMADLITQRLSSLANAETLEVMRLMPGRCHELKHDLTGFLALDLVHPMRLVFRPMDVPPPENEGDSLDWSTVTHVQIYRIENYHE